MDYNTYEPSADLAAFIKCFWSLKVPKEHAAGKQQILPDGCLEMIFSFGDDIKRYKNATEFVIQPRSFLIGQITKPFLIEPMGVVDTFAARFYPDSLRHFINIPLNKLADRETDLKSVFEPDRVEELVGNISETESTKERIKLIEEFLHSVLQKKVDANELVMATINSIFETKGSLGVDEMLGANKSKRRQLERKFSTTVGLSPKQLCRIIRLQSALKLMLKKNNMDLTRIGNENEYFDQSHFIRDFKEFAGVSPGEFYKDKSFELSSIFYTPE